MDFTGWFDSIGTTISGVADTASSTVENVSGSVASARDAWDSLFSGNKTTPVSNAGSKSVFSGNTGVVIILVIAGIGIILAKKARLI